MIRLGEVDFSRPDESNTVDYRIADIVRHPKYRAGGDAARYYDIAVSCFEKNVRVTFYPKNLLSF